MQDIEIKQLLHSNIVAKMFDLMYENDGVGLAAPQVMSLNSICNIVLFYEIYVICSVGWIK